MLCYQCVCDLPVVIKNRVSLQDIIQETAFVYGVTVEEMVSPVKKRSIVLARMAYCFLAKKLTSKTLVEIAAGIGKIHTSVTYLIKQKKNMEEIYNEGTEAIHIIEQRLQEGLRNNSLN